MLNKLNKVASGGVFAVVLVALLFGSVAHAAVGDGNADAVSGDDPADAWAQISDYGIENAPTIVAIIGGLFLVGLAFYLFRRGLRRARSAMRI